MVTLDFYSNANIFTLEYLAVKQSCLKKVVSSIKQWVEMY